MVVVLFNVYLWVSRCLGFQILKDIYYIFDFFRIAVIACEVGSARKQEGSEELFPAAEKVKNFKDSKLVGEQRFNGEEERRNGELTKNGGDETENGKKQ